MSFPLALVYVPIFITTNSCIRFESFFWVFFCPRRVIFTGTVVVIPDISALAAPGERAECRRDSSQQKSSTAGHEGVKGLKALGVRDLSYRLAFIANSVQVCHL